MNSDVYSWISIRTGSNKVVCIEARQKVANHGFALDRRKQSKKNVLTESKVQNIQAWISTCNLFRRLAQDLGSVFIATRLRFIFITFNGVRLSPLGTAATTGLFYEPQMIDDGDCGAIGGMKIGRGNQSTRRKPAAAPFCPPQIPHDHPVLEPDRRGGNPATNHLSYGAAYHAVQYLLKFSPLLIAKSTS
jgi:hypothetical protein